MSSIHRAATIGGLTAISAATALFARHIIVHRESFARSLNPTTRIGLLRLVLLLFSLLNIKNLPFVWHIRFLVRALLYHFRIEPKSVPPASLFEPLVTSTRAPLLECDTNLHKSNSTYFSDLDQSRAHLYACLMQKAFTREWTDDFVRPRSRPDLEKSDVNQHSKAVKDGSAIANGSPTPEVNFNLNNTPKPYPAPKGRYNMLLGSVSCHYHREIPPYTRYELWSRILSWDDKWFYSVTHIVKPGVAAPKRWTMQPWRTTSTTKTSNTTKRKNTREKQGSEDSMANGECSSRATATANGQIGTKDAETDAQTTSRITKLKDSIYATSIAKVVVKRGRLTIPPEIVLQRSGMLPPRPGAEHEAKPSAEMTLLRANGNGSAAMDGTTFPGASTDADPDIPTSSPTSSSSSLSSSSWTWQAMEERRLQGMQLAARFAELDAAQALFDGGREGALGEYADLFWA